MFAHRVGVMIRRVLKQVGGHLIENWPGECRWNLESPAILALSGKARKSAEHRKDDTVWNALGRHDLSACDYLPFHLLQKAERLLAFQLFIQFPGIPGHLNVESRGTFP